MDPGAIRAQDAHRKLLRKPQVVMEAETTRAEPLAGREDENRWNEQTRTPVLKNYNQLDMFI